MSEAAALPPPDRILTKPISTEMLRFGLPIALGMGLQTTFNLVDAYVIARLHPEVAGPALGALGICDQLSAIGTIMSYGLTTASTAMIAQAHGRGDRERVRALVWQSILAVTALSILFGFMSVAFAGPILAGVVGAKGAVAALGTSYLRVNSGGAFSMFFLLQLTGIQRSLGSSKTPVALLVLSNVINLFLAVLLVYGPGDAPPVFSWGPPLARILHLPRMELLGAAWATVIARTLTLIPVVYLLARRFDVLDRKSITRPDAPVLKQIWKVAWPSSTQFVVGRRRVLRRGSAGGRRRGELRGHRVVELSWPRDRGGARERDHRRWSDANHAGDRSGGGVARAGPGLRGGRALAEREPGAAVGRGDADVRGVGSGVSGGLSRGAVDAGDAFGGRGSAPGGPKRKLRIRRHRRGGC